MPTGAPNHRPGPARRSGFTRRRFLQSLGTIGVAGAAAVVTRNAIATAPQRAQVHRPPHFEGTLWHDPRTWPNGRVPGPGDVAQITRPVILDANARVAGVEIAPQGALVFAPQATARLESSGNVVVRGRLAMRPQSAAVVHTLRFVGVDEKAFKGGGMQPIPTDVGLWVMDKGVLDAQGTPRAGWNRIGTDPTWRGGDEILAAPQQAGDYSTFAAFTQGAAVPTVRYEGVDYPTEVFNLTRNVLIEGTPTGRAHVFIHSTSVHTINYVAFRYLGPRTLNDKNRGAIVVGRYGLHFHHCRDSTRDSVVQGVVVRDCGAHAFVPHNSHGITFRDCIAFGVNESAYWWDPEESRNDYPTNSSMDIRYEHCAVFDWHEAHDNTYREDAFSPRSSAAAFELGAGEGNACVDCVVAGMRGRVLAGGFAWPSKANNRPNLWEFRGCVVHNGYHGIAVWQNGSASLHPIEAFVAYRCAATGISHGAYGNLYDYFAPKLYECGEGGAVIHATNYGRWVTPRLIGSPYGLIFPKHVLVDPPNVFTFYNAVIEATASAVLVDEKAESGRGVYDLIHPVVSGRDMEPGDFEIRSIHPNSRYRVLRRDNTAFEVTAIGIRDIPAFA